MACFTCVLCGSPWEFPAPHRDLAGLPSPTHLVFLLNTGVLHSCKTCNLRTIGFRFSKSEKVLEHNRSPFLQVQESPEKCSLRLSSLFPVPTLNFCWPQGELDERLVHLAVLHHSGTTPLHEEYDPNFKPPKNTGSVLRGVSLVCAVCVLKRWWTTVGLLFFKNETG